MTPLRLPWLFALLLAFAPSDAAGAVRRSPWESSLISIEAARKTYDYLQPWTRRLDTVLKSGVVIGPQQILTTADFLNDTTLIRLQKGGRGQWQEGRLSWIDYHANLALVTSTNPAFWPGLKPVPLAPHRALQGPVELKRWRNGRMESYQGEISRLTVKRGKLSWVEHLQVEINSEINNAGWAEAVVVGTKLLGLTCSQDGNHCTALPAAFIDPILKARQSGHYPGLGYFDFIWQKSENPASLAYLNLPGDPRGVIVVDPGHKPGFTSPVQAKDILLRIEGHDLDTEGDYTDAQFGKLSLENLAHGSRFAGDQLPITLWRDGRLLTVNYRLPVADYRDELVPLASFDQAPEYLIAGGLVFQPLTIPYLQVWGTDWRRKAPFRLVYYTQEKPTPSRPGRVLLSLVLPDPSNIGYQDYRFLVVDRVNGQEIGHLSQLAEALNHPREGYHLVEFAPSEAVQKLVLDAREMPAANARILREFGIQQDRQLATHSPEESQ